MNTKDRIEILNKIFEAFQHSTQNRHNTDYVFYYEYIEADAYIKLLEKEDCGQIYGHDDSNPFINITGSRLYDRFLTVIRKYNNEKDIKKVWYFELDDLTTYFKVMMSLRETFKK